MQNRYFTKYQVLEISVRLYCGNIFERDGKAWTNAPELVVRVI